VLNGEKPNDLPVRHVAKLELVINLEKALINESSPMCRATPKAPRTAQVPRTRMRAADPDDLIYLGLERQIILLRKVLCILHHLKDINGGRGTHNHAGPRSIGIDRQHAGHGDCGGNDSCREND